MRQNRQGCVSQRKVVLLECAEYVQAVTVFDVMFHGCLRLLSVCRLVSFLKPLVICPISGIRHSAAIIINRLSIVAGLALDQFFVPLDLLFCWL